MSHKVPGDASLCHFDVRYFLDLANEDFMRMYAGGRGNERNGFQLFRELSVVSYDTRDNEARGYMNAWVEISSTCTEGDSGRS